MTEEWLPVTIEYPKYLGRYEVSNHGRVRSSPHVRIVGSKAGRILSQAKDDRGYMQVSLCYDMGRHTVKVARLVATAFLGPRPEGMTINHVDRDKANNHVSNLEYISGVANTRHSLERHLVNGEHLSLSDAIDRFGGLGVTLKTVHRRMNRLKWTAHDAVTLPRENTGRPTDAAIAERKR